MAPPAFLVGHVTSAGVTPKAATVKTTIQKYDKFLRKHYTRELKLHISDPTSSLHTHDTVRLVRNPYLSPSPNIKHTVTAILSPWGPPLASRPPLLTDEERAARRATQIIAKGGARALRLQRGQIVIDAGGRVRATPPEGMGWKRFAGTVETAVREAELKKKDAEGERGKEEGEGKSKRQERGVLWVDAEGRRRAVQSATMLKMERLRQEALRAAGRKKAVQREVEAEGVDVEKRLEGLEISGGEIKAAEEAREMRV